MEEGKEGEEEEEKQRQRGTETERSRLHLASNSVTDYREDVSTAVQSVSSTER